MKEKPIIFSTEMVKAILEGRKTQTRRPIKPQPPENCDYPLFDDSGYGFFYDGLDDEVFPTGDNGICSRYQPGDRLWVKETWAVHSDVDTLSPSLICVALAGDYAGCIDYLADDNKKDWSGKWRPAIYMPRWASRITLEVTNVRVERVKEISEADAKMEGIEQSAGMSNYEKKGLGWNTNPFVWVVEFKKLLPEKGS